MAARTRSGDCWFIFPAGLPQILSRPFMSNIDDRQSNVPIDPCEHPNEFLQTQPLQTPALQIREAWLIHSKNAGSDELIKTTEEGYDFAS